MLNLLIFSLCLVWAYTLFPADSAGSTAETEVAVDQPAAPVVREVPFRTGVVVSDPVRTGTGQVRREPATP